MILSFCSRSLDQELPPCFGVLHQETTHGPHKNFRSTLKLYIYQNPVKAGLCKYAEDYYYSSASFYYSGDRRWDFLVHVDG
jgi:hypothetical protein